MNLAFIEKIVLGFLERNPELVEKLIKAIVERLIARFAEIPVDAPKA